MARPQRYAVNPVFRAKFLLMAPAILLTLTFHLLSIKDPAFWERSGGRRVAAKLLGASTLLLWILVAMAGRWIAYADYLLPAEE